MVAGKEGITVCSDDHLVEMIVSGDADQFKHIVERYQHYVYAILLNITGDNNDIQDLAQEVFIGIYRALPSYHGGSFKGLVGRIAANRAIDWKRARARAPAFISSLPVENLVQKDKIVSLEAIVIRRENREIVRRMCRELPSLYSSTVEKYYFENKTCEEIAVEEGISIKTVESRLYRARAMIRERWEGDRP